MVVVEAIEKARGKSSLGCGLEDGDGRSWAVHAGGSGASSVLQPACLVVMLELSRAAHQRYVGEERINVAAGPPVPKHQHHCISAGLPFQSFSVFHVFPCSRHTIWKNLFPKSTGIKSPNHEVLTLDSVVISTKPIRLNNPQPFSELSASYLRMSPPNAVSSPLIPDDQL